MLTGVAGAFFYIFAFVLLTSALMVVFARNPVHSVLFLILAFFNAAALFLLTGAEFLAMILLIVYVGAVAVLFLFVVMMLDIDSLSLKQGLRRHGGVGLAVGIVFLVELLLVLNQYFSPISDKATSIKTNLTSQEAVPTNTEALGNVLYTDYVFYFEVSGLILLLAMVAAIILTLHHRTGAKRQSIARQVNRNPQEAIELKDIDSGKGI